MKTGFQKYKQNSRDLAYMAQLAIKYGVTSIADRERMLALNHSIDTYRNSTEYKIIIQLIDAWNRFKYSRTVMILRNRFVR